MGKEVTGTRLPRIDIEALALKFLEDCTENLIQCCAGRYLEIFGRKNNLHNYWVTVGNEVTGTGLPKEDIEALAAGAGIPSAVFGRSTAKSNDLDKLQTGS